MYCKKCGSKLIDNAVFCVNCGAKIEAPQNQAAPQSQEVPQNQPTPAPQSQEVPQNRPTPAPQSQEVPQNRPTPAPQSQAAPQNQTPKKSSGGKIAAVIAIVLVLLVGSTAGVYVMYSQGLLPGFSKTDKNKTAVYESEAVVATEAMGPFTETAEAGTESFADTEETETAEDTETEGTAEDSVIMIAADTVEGILQQKIFEMNDEAYEAAVIDVYRTNYEVGTRDTSATWDNDVFYTLEGYATTSGYIDKNLCQLTKKELRNAENSDIMQYEIYINPDTGIANKIVSIEYLSDGLEITEYYFDKNAKVSFIFQYTADNYVSTFATPDKTGDRYLFCNDSVVTWRSITESEKINYVLGDAEVDRMKDQFAKSTMRYYSELDEAMQEEFDARELRMLNAAYNTYNTVMNSEGIAHIQGYAYDGTGGGIKDALVELYTADFSQKMYQTTTDENGMYTIYVPNEEYDYNLCIKKTGLTETKIYAIGMSSEQIGAYQDSVYLFDESLETAEVQMTLGDALEYADDGTGMKKLAGAQVLFRQGINNRSGDIVVQETADDNGMVYVTINPGIYTIEVNETDYQTMYYSVVANPLIETNTYEFYATPTLSEGEYAIVLTWGATPADLDSHLFTTSGSSSDHIWYGAFSDDFNSYLDVDDTSSYGPETVTIRSFDANNYYKYCVVDFTDCARGAYKSLAMSESMACVNVYSSDGLLASFSVPTGKEGVIWEVFEIRNGQITPIQRYYGNVEDETWWHSDK